MNKFFTYFTIFVLWINCGLAAVYLGGVADKINNKPNTAPIGFLFIAGPIGLGLAGTVTVLSFLFEGKTYFALQKVYNSGNKN